MGLQEQKKTQSEPLEQYCGEGGMKLGAYEFFVVRESKQCRYSIT
jgi:hypothetical protein